MSRSRKTGLAALAAVAFTLAGPATVRAQDPGEDPTEAAEQPAPEAKTAPSVVRVTNHNWLDMRLYLSRDGGPLESLGFVTSQAVGEFELPAATLLAGNGFRIVADPIGGRGVYVSPDLYVSPGTDLVITLENALNLSHASLRTRAEQP